MPKTIISDTSCLIALTNIGELEILNKVYPQIFTTKDVLYEFGEPLPSWIQIIPVSNTEQQQLLEKQLDKGEASAIALALEYPGSLIILDDYKGRTIAEKLGIEITGTLGVLIKAKKENIISSIKPQLTKLKNARFRLTRELEQEALREAGEL